MRMNIAGHQEKNEKMGNREAREERKRLTNFKEAARCPSAVVQRAAWQKMVCIMGVPRVTGTLGKANSHFDSVSNGVRDCTITFTQLLIFARETLLVVQSKLLEGGYLNQAIIPVKAV